MRDVPDLTTDDESHYICNACSWICYVRIVKARHQLFLLSIARAGAVESCFPEREMVDVKSFIVIHTQYNMLPVFCGGLIAMI